MVASRWCGLVTTLAMISVSCGYGTDGSRTPTIVAGRSLSLMTVPITDGSLRNAVVQKRWVSTAAPSAFGPSSAALSSRPSTGRRPITSKYDPPTTPARTVRGSPSPIIVNSMVEKSPNALRDFTRRLEVPQLGHGEVRVLDADAPGGLAEVDQPVRVAVDQRAQQHATNHAEDGGVGADPQRQRHDDGERQALGAAEGAERVFEVGQQAHA